MGEYAEQYILEQYGVDIGEPDEKKKSRWKYHCDKCGKNFSSQNSLEQHKKDKHGAMKEVK